MTPFEAALARALHETHPEAAIGDDAIVRALAAAIVRSIAADPAWTPVDGLREAGLRIARLKVPAHWGTGDGALAYEEALETAVAVAHAVLSQRLEALSHVHEWEDGWDDETEWYCPGCGMTGDPAAPAPLDGLREALRTIREICKPMSMTMTGPKWFEGGTPAGGGSRERIWRICDAALRDEGETT